MKENATPRKLAELLSAKTGISERDLRTRVQYLREAGLQPGGEFGDSKAARLTLKAAANQILGITAPVQIAVASYVRRVGDLQCDPSRYQRPEFAGSGVEHVLPLLKGKTFISAIVHLLRAMTAEHGHQIVDQVKGLGVIEGAGEVQAWIEPRMSTAWKEQKKAAQRIYFGRVGVIPLATYFTRETSLNAVVLYEAAQLFSHRATQGEPYAEEDTFVTGRPPRGRNHADDTQGVQRAAEVGAA